MAIRIFNISKWSLLREGEAMAYRNPKQRMVRIDVNSPTEVSYYVRQKWDDVVASPEEANDTEAGRFHRLEGFIPGSLDDANGSDWLLSFVGVCKGRDTLEFAVEGAFELLVEGGPAYIYTLDGQDSSLHVVAPYIYTRIANRRQRNPHLEMVQYQMKLSQDAFQASMMREMERRVEAVKKGLETHAAQRDAGTPALRPARAAPVPGGVSAEREEPSEPGDTRNKGDGGGSGNKRKRTAAPPLVPNETGGEDDD